MQLVDVRIDSKPAGATVMLVDNGKTSFLGSTPVAASLDPSRAYDVIFTLENHPTQMVHVDPTKTRHVELVLGHNGSAGKVTTTARTASKPAAQLAEPSFEAPKPAAAPKAAAHKGTLMVTSKPPCEIWIDGASTGLSTPQKAIPLAPGAHKITFVNTADNINKTVPVTITADQSTKLIQNLMQ